MSLAEFVGLFLFAVQQLGVALGVGAETVFLFLLAKDEPAEAVYQGKRVTSLALWLIVLSGIFITLADIAAGQGGVIAEPAYLFKWLLIFILIVIAILVRFEIFPRKLLAGLSGGTWYALFVLHTLAPEAPWLSLLVPYFAWLVVFIGGFLLATRSKTVGAELRPTAIRTPARVISSEVIVPTTPKTGETFVGLKEFKPAAPPPQPAPITKPVLPQPPLPKEIKTGPLAAPKPPSPPVLQKPTAPVVPRAPMTKPEIRIHQPIPIATLGTLAKETRPPVLQPMLRPVVAQTPVTPPSPTLPSIQKPQRAIPSLVTIPTVGVGWKNPSTLPHPEVPLASVKAPEVQKQETKPPSVPATPVIPRAQPVAMPATSVQQIKSPPAAAPPVKSIPTSKPFQYEGLSHVTVMPRSAKEINAKKNPPHPNSEPQTQKPL